jgi:HEAT repeat protein
MIMWRIGQRVFGLLIPGLLAAAITAGVCSCSPPADPARATVQVIVENLAAQRYGNATAIYREAEEVVLSEAAAGSWRRALGHEDATVRQWAVDALSRIGDPADLPLVVDALDDSFRKVQEIAAEGLMRMDPDHAREVFMQRLDAADVLARVLAAQTLADMGETAAVPAMIEQLQNDSLDDGVRDVMAQSLGRLRDSRAAMPLVELALDESADLQLRRSAADAVTLLPAEESREALLRLGEADDAYIRDLAERALRD